MEQPSTEQRLTPLPHLSLARLPVVQEDPSLLAPPPPPTPWRLQTLTRALRVSAGRFGLCTLLVFVLLWLYEGPFRSLISYLLYATSWPIIIADREPIIELINQLYQLLVYPLVFVPPYLLYLRLIGRSAVRLPRARLDPPVLFSSVGIAMGASLFGSILAAILIILSELLGIFPSYPQVFLPENPVSIVLFVVNMALAPAVFEELLYRGIILQSLRVYGDGLALVISSLFFGLMHQNLFQIPHATVLGFAIGYLVIQTGSIYTGIWIHFINNGIVTLLLFAEEWMDYWQLAMASLGRLILCGIAFIAAVLYLCIRRKVRWTLPRAPDGLPPTRALLAFLAHPVIVVTVVVMALSATVSTYAY